MSKLLHPESEMMLPGPTSPEDVSTWTGVEGWEVPAAVSAFARVTAVPIPLTTMPYSPSKSKHCR